MKFLIFITTILFAVITLMINKDKLDVDKYQVVWVNNRQLLNAFLRGKKNETLTKGNKKQGNETKRKVITNVLKKNEVENKKQLLSMETFVCVLTRRSAEERRNTLRKTWALNHKNVFFSVGRCCNIPPENRKKTYTCKRASDSSIDRQKEWSETCKKEDKKIEEESQKFNDMIFMDTVDVYRHLPQKVKYCYQWGLENTNAKWFLKTDDDSFVRVDTLDVSLKHTFPDASKPYVIGQIAKGWPVHRGGKWAELNYKPNKYPNFPLGSAGHVVSRSVATYINDNRDTLFNYQGEDVSIGIWLDESPLKSKIVWKSKWDNDKGEEKVHFTNHGNCNDKNYFVIGHLLTPSAIRSCYSNTDENHDYINSKSTNVKQNFLKINFIGRTGNNMFQLASALGLASLNKMIPCYTGSTNIDKLIDFGIGKCSSGKYVRKVERGYATHQKFKFDSSSQVGNYLQSYKYFISKTPLKLLPKWQQYGKKYIQTHAGVFVPIGIHVRRKDHLKYNYLRFPPNAYFINAIDYFKRKHKNVYFFVASDDVNWCKKQPYFQGFHFLSGTPLEDMAILSQTSGMIMSLGTFSWWSAFLGKKKVVVYNKNEFDLNHAINKGKVIKEDYYPKEWIAIDALTNAKDINTNTKCGLNSKKRDIREFFGKGGNSVKYFSKPFNFRKNATIIDIGSYTGVDLISFMKSKRYDVDIFTYEPVPSIRKILKKNVEKYKNIHINNYGLSNSTFKTCFKVHGDATHTVSINSPECDEHSEIHDITSEVMKFERIDLLHVNCEGCEFPVLKRLLSSTSQTVEAIEFQFHPQHLSVEDYCLIEKLLKNNGYEMIYRYKFVWELWKRPKKTFSPKCKWPNPLYTSSIGKVDTKSIASDLQKLEAVIKQNKDNSFAYMDTGAALHLYRDGGIAETDSDIDINWGGTAKPPKVGNKISINRFEKWGDLWTLQMKKSIVTEKIVKKLWQDKICIFKRGDISFYTVKNMRLAFENLFGAFWFVRIPFKGVHDTHDWYKHVTKKTGWGAYFYNALRKIEEMDTNGDNMISIEEVNQKVTHDNINSIEYELQISQRDRCRAAAMLTFLLKYKTSPFKIEKYTGYDFINHPLFKFPECDK